MSWDYIIVGAGSAGCALAGELVKSGRTVLLLEAGGSDRSPFIKVPAGQPRASAKHDWGYRSQPDPTRGGAREKWKRGRVLGGSSSINGMIYIRGAAEDFDRWAKSLGHVGGWSAKEVMPIFREMECSDQNDPLRGCAGPLHVSTVRHPHAITRAFIASARTAGHPFNDDYNAHTQEGVGYMQRSLRNGLRCSSADAFIKPLLGRKNLRLLLNALVEKIELEKGRAVAVSLVHKGQRLRETARDIILCAGAINSPKLMMLSGIGDSRELEKHGIHSVLDRPAVGHHLKDHPAIRMIYRSKVPTYNLTEGLLQKIGIAAKYLIHREGPISVVYEGAGFLKTSPIEPIPDIQLLFAPLGVLGKIGGNIRLAPFPAFMPVILHSYPLSSGRVRLASGDPSAPPLIENRMLAEPSDIDGLVRGIEVIRSIVSKEPIAGMIEAEVTPGDAFTGREALRQFVRENTEVALHAMGTCRMGMDQEAIVDPDLRVRGTENLWIADASIFPDPISANINAACMMIGAKLGRQLAARRELK